MITELIQTNPRVGIIILAALVSLFISLINYLVLDKEKVKKSKEKQKNLQKQLKENKHNKEKVMELNQELLSHSLENFKHSFKPMLITIIPVLVVFWWIKDIFSETAISGSWFWYYLIGAILFSIIFRKIFKLP